MHYGHIVSSCPLPSSIFAHIVIQYLLLRSFAWSISSQWSKVLYFSQKSINCFLLSWNTIDCWLDQLYQFNTVLPPNTSILSLVIRKENIFRTGKEEKLWKSYSIKLKLWKECSIIELMISIAFLLEQRSWGYLIIISKLLPFVCKKKSHRKACGLCQASCCHFYLQLVMSIWEGIFAQFLTRKGHS